MAGLHFYKLDLHTHTPASKCYLDKKHTAEEIVHAALAKGLNGIAITDHNTGEWIDTMKKAAEGKGLAIFPGVELSLEQGHLVALFDPSATQKDIEGLLGSLDITPDEFGKSETVCTKNIYDVVDKIHDRHGLAILAHIDQMKGIFHDNVVTKSDGKISVPMPLRKLLNEAKYDAVECADGRLPNGFDQAHDVTAKPAIYQASDNPDPKNPTKHSLDGLATRYSSFKVDSINLEGLRQCFADPEVRIRLMGDDKDTPYHRIVSLKVGETGFLHHQNFGFHEGLNSLIGGKGVGKSLAIEFLRFGLDQSSLDDNIRKDHIKKLQKRLTFGNTIEIVYQRADGSQFKITRKFEGPENERGHSLDIQGEITCINLATDESYMGDIASTFPILAYSQTEVIDIAESKTAQLGLIDQFIVNDLRALEQEIDLLGMQLHENDVALDQSLQAKSKLTECEREIHTLKLRIEAINKALENELFDKMKQSEAKKEAAESQTQFVANLAEQIKGWASELDDISAPGVPDELTDDAFLKAQNKKAEQARTRVLKMINDLAVEMKKTQTVMTEAVDSWIPEFNKVKEGYDQLLKEIGGDQEAKERERKRLEREKSTNENEADQYRSLDAALKGVLDERQEMLTQMEKAHEQVYQVRKTKFDHLIELSDNKLNLMLDHAADRSAFEEKLMDFLKGSGQNAVSVSERKTIAQNLSPRRFVELIIDRNTHELASEAEISETMAGRVIERLWSGDDFVEVLALQHNCYPADVPTIHYRKEGGEYAEISELSVGQKCTALLIIALCDGDMPVVIDQPEDALDIISVWEDIAKKLRRGKNTRQFILTTHNASVAVAADSDQFIVLKAGANSGKVVASGAIDRPEVRKAVIEHMEGGEEPMRLRLKKYNLS